MKHTLIFLFLLYSTLNFANTFEVGSTKNYDSPNALYSADVIADGDTILIDAETYAGNACLAVWQKNDLFIKGVGGKPKLDAMGQYIWGKGIWVLAGNNITIDNIEFSGATVPDQNGAGIRLDGIGLTVRHCYFHDNDDGILTGNPYDGDILIEYSEFGNNGFGDGYSHNLYIGHVNKLVFQYNYSHHAKVGHVLKSRANENYILYNRLMDEETGNSSRLIDLSNGGFSIIMGNILMQGPAAENNNMIGYGKEGLSNSNNELYCINNTFVNKRSTCIFVDIQSGTTVANISNNIMAGIGTPINGLATINSQNLIDNDLSIFGLVDEANYDYQLSDNSPAIDFGSTILDVNGISLTPIFSYQHPLNKEERTIFNSIDAGAYESDLDVAVEDNPFNKIVLFPNPTQDIIYINDFPKGAIIKVVNTEGQVVIKNIVTNYIDLSGLPSGIYYLKIKLKEHPTKVKMIVKK